jgi:ribosome-binding ATPase YchF (GTP1/OBG family)
VKIGLVGLAAVGKSTVFGALTGLPVETGYGAGGGKANVGVVKVPDSRVDALAAIYQPKKTTYAEINFTDLGGKGDGIDRSLLNAMRPVEALCQVVRAFPDAAGAAAEPAQEIADLEIETILADLSIAEQRVERLERDHSNPRELELMRRVQQSLEDGRPLRTLELADDERSALAGYTFLSLKPLLVVLNVSEDAIGEPVPPELEKAAQERGLGLVVLSAQVEMDVAQLPAEE